MLEQPLLAVEVRPGKQRRNAGHWPERFIEIRQEGSTDGNDRTRLARSTCPGVGLTGHWYPLSLIRLSARYARGAPCRASGPIWHLGWPIHRVACSLATPHRKRIVTDACPPSRRPWPTATVSTRNSDEGDGHSLPGARVASVGRGPQGPQSELSKTWEPTASSGRSVSPAASTTPTSWGCWTPVKWGPPLVYHPYVEGRICRTCCSGSSS